MNFFGKLVGGIAGLATGKWPLALFGLLLGHQFDRGVTHYRRAKLPALFAPTLFSVMGHLAKADGRVSEDEIRVARLAMHALNLDGEATRAAMRSFNSGKQPDFDAEAALLSLRKQTSATHRVGRRLIELLLPVLLVKPQSNAGERNVLWQVCQVFDISRVELAQIEAAAHLNAQYQQSGLQPSAQDAASLAFTKLGLSPDASDSQIKTSYRRLMNRYHPDKLAGENADAQTLDEASRKTREIREAYELLRDRRGFR
ncbi:MAG: co-chaperone DjlA [Pseudomonadota bacterium]